MQFSVLLAPLLFCKPIRSASTILSSETLLQHTMTPPNPHLHVSFLVLGGVDDQI
jgi:hypothetical protein